MKKAGTILCLMVASVSLAEPVNAPSVRRGEELFNSTNLGTNGNKCSDCHPGGEGLEKAAGYGDEKLVSIVNRCITNLLKGKSLAPDSPDLASIIMYVKSLARPAKP